ncbi:MAG: adenylate/guanylate cyclase domain-containing protein [Acidimicrobiia bacterium]|nr:adenylate/guanylate cyclase domain-containing protein [Acidimicrobiia bacterium]
MTADDDVVITVTQANQRPLVLLLQGELIVGRDCEGLLIADSEVSRRHLRLRRRGRAVEVSDLGSTNGTFLDGVELTKPELIDSTSRVAIGETNLDVEVRSSTPSRGARAVGQETEVRVDDLRSTSIDLLAASMPSDSGSLPTGDLGAPTITMVFSDIESSTERAAEMGDTAWFALLDEHNQLFRSELQKWGGTEVKSMGDGFMLTFPNVRRAVRFATAIQRRVEGDDGPDVKVRMGVHTGEAIPDITGDLFGRHVNLAARVANLAAGGQILASLVVHEIAKGQDDVHFSEPFLAELKGFSEPQTLYELLWE